MDMNRNVPRFAEFSSLDPKEVNSFIRKLLNPGPKPSTVGNHNPEHSRQVAAIAAHRPAAASHVLWRFSQYYEDLEATVRVFRVQGFQGVQGSGFGNRVPRPKAPGSPFQGPAKPQRMATQKCARRTRKY